MNARRERYLRLLVGPARRGNASRSPIVWPAVAAIARSRDEARMTSGAHLRLIWVAIAVLVIGCSGPGPGATPIIVYVTPAPGSTPFDAAPIPEPAGGAGVITFGTRVDPDTLLIDKPVTRFKRTFPEIAWSAHLSREPGATKIQWSVASRSTTGVELTIIDEEHTISNPTFDLFGNAADLAFLLDNKAGTYVMRYIESGEILAEGTFTLVK